MDDGDGRRWTDILFHVNSRTSRKLGHLLSFTEDRYNDTYKNRWGPGKDSHLSTDVSHHDFQDYLSGDSDL